MKTLLSIETSCDETAIAITSFDDEQNIKNNNSIDIASENAGFNFSLLTNNILSQINIHREFGGVFPAVAKREHAKNITALFEKSLKEAGLYKEKKENVFTDLEVEKIEKLRGLLDREEEMFSEIVKLTLKIEKPDLDAIAVTAGPGLAPALWVGINFAKAFSIFWDLPVYPINHMEGHIMSALIKPVEENKFNNKFFLKDISKNKNLSLLISGGHTEIIYFEDFQKYKKIGQTLDDAIGEAFDKTARLLDLPYPGGPEISRLAEMARIEKAISPFPLGGAGGRSEFKLPRPMLHSNDFNFSFSGLKTSVLYLVKKLNGVQQNKPLSQSTDSYPKNSGEQNAIAINNIPLDLEIKKQVALEFENAATEILIAKVKKAIQKYNTENLVIGGGVSANKFIRENFENLCNDENVNLYLPEKNLTGDNAFMIAAAAMIQILNNKSLAYISEIVAKSNWSIEEI